jgi:ketosteroid isomerase-like protein
VTALPDDAPTAVVDRYTEELYHRRNLDALDELVAEPMIRHEPGGHRVALSRAETRARIASFHQQFRSMRFSTRLVVDDGTRVATAYEADLVDHDGEIHTICGIEVFVVENGRIVEVWNPPSGDGSWG